MEDTKTLGKRILMIRADATETDFSNLLGIPPAVLSEIELDQRAPSAELLVQLNVLYGIEPMWILTGKGSAIGSDDLTADEAGLILEMRMQHRAGASCLPVLLKQQDEITLMDSYRSVTDKDRTEIRLFLDAVVLRSVESGTNKNIRKNSKK